MRAPARGVVLRWIDRREICGRFGRINAMNRLIRHRARRTLKPTSVSCPLPRRLSRYRRRAPSPPSRDPKMIQTA